MLVYSCTSHAAVHTGTAAAITSFIQQLAALSVIDIVEHCKRCVSLVQERERNACTGCGSPAKVYMALYTVQCALLAVPSQAYVASFL
jgi:hypothetical protein